MKNILLITFILISNFASGQQYYRPEYSTDSTYGYSPLNPLTFASDNPIINVSNTYDFFTNLRTPNNKKLILLSNRTSIRDPRYTEEQHKKRAEENSKKGKWSGGMLDCYTLVTKNGKVYVKLYVDIYTKGTPKVPHGLKWKD
ncbi:MAG: hypothetical protein JNK00_06600 [Flavipsychrobacter sp.]|nr:hypothetical protein [Flavipsychrobacter sp.]